LPTKNLRLGVSEGGSGFNLDVA